MGGVQRKDLERALNDLDIDTRQYLERVVARIEADKRFDFRLNVAYLILEGCCEAIVPDLEEPLFVERLHGFLEVKGRALSNKLFQPDFIYNRQHVVHMMALDFIADIAAELLDKVRDGKLKGRETSVHRFNAATDDPDDFPYYWDGDDEDDF